MAAGEAGSCGVRSWLQRRLELPSSPRSAPPEFLAAPASYSVSGWSRANEIVCLQGADLRETVASGPRISDRRPCERRVWARDERFVASILRQYALRRSGKALSLQKVTCPQPNPDAVGGVT